MVFPSTASTNSPPMKSPVLGEREEREGGVSDWAFAMGRGELVPRHEIRPTHLKDDLPFHDSSLNS